VIDIERIAGFEVERELTAFGTQPEPILAAEDVHVRLAFATRNRLTPDPAERRRPVRGARHHTPLILRRDDDLGARAVA